MCSDDTYAGSFGLLVYDIFIGHILTMHIGWHKRENGMDWNLKYIRQIYLILIGSIADLTMLWCHLQYGRRKPSIMSTTNHKTPHCCRV